MKTINFYLLIILFFLSSRFAYAVDLKIATYNIGMLNVANPVPFYEERLSLLKREFLKVIDTEKIDIIAIQEAWTLRSHEILDSIHEDYEFKSIDGDAWIPLLEHKTGLGFFVKKSLKAKISFINYKTREAYTCGFGQICDRGILALRIKHGEGELHFFNTHLTPMYNLTSYRRNQVKEILLNTAEVYRLNRANEVVILGDFNLSKVFGEFSKKDDGVKEDWDKNSKLYDLFFIKNKVMNCVDTYNKKRDGYDFTQHRETNKTAQVSKSSGIAPSQRNDFIVVCAKQNSGFRVSSNKLIFNEALNENMHLSDHYGVLTTLKSL